MAADLIPQVAGADTAFPLQDVVLEVTETMKLRPRASPAALDEDPTRKTSKFRAVNVLVALRDRYDRAMQHWEKEKVLLKMNWKLLLTAAIFQYVHSVATNVVYFLHIPREPLFDLGFAVLPALSRQMQVLSEVMFFILFFGTIGFMLSPFFAPRKGLYFAVMISRFCGVLVLAQSLRIISFMVTVLPGPNYHCRPLSPDYSPPTNAYDIFMRQDAFFGCGDLVFSSHTIFVLLCALTYHKYAPPAAIKNLVWVLVGFFGLLVVSARKHYSLDIVVAWYTVPLLWIAYDKYYPDRVPTELDRDGEDVETVAAPKEITLV